MLTLSKRDMESLRTFRYPASRRVSRSVSKATDAAASYGADEGIDARVADRVDIIPVSDRLIQIVLQSVPWFGESRYVEGDIRGDPSTLTLALTLTLTWN